MWRPSVARFLVCAALLILSAAPVYGKDAAAFCKCICGSESQIIALNPPETEDGSSSSLVRRSAEAFGSAFDSISVLDFRALGRRADDEDKDDDKKDDEKDSTKRTKTCADCNRQFCLDYNLPKCKTLPEEEVTTDCFKRDSSKDQAVVLIFIGATVSLLGWAILRPWVGKFVEKAQDRRQAYAPLSGSEALR